MKNLVCDTIGCRRDAKWARVTLFSTDCLDYLCQGCWNRLRMMKPEESACYLRILLEGLPANVEEKLVWTETEAAKPQSDALPTARVHGLNPSTEGA